MSTQQTATTVTDHSDVISRAVARYTKAREIAAEKERIAQELANQPKVLKFERKGNALDSEPQSDFAKMLYRANKEQLVTNKVGQ